MSVVASDQYASLKLAEKRKNDNLLKTKIILNRNISQVVARFSHLTLATEVILAPRPPSVTPLQQKL